MIAGQGEKPQRHGARLRHEKRQRIRRLTKEMFVDGKTAAELAETEGVTKRRLHALLDSAGVVRAGRARHRAILAHIRDENMTTLDGMAANAGVTRAEMIDRILSVALEDKGRSAHRILGKLAGKVKP